MDRAAERLEPGDSAEEKVSMHHRAPSTASETPSFQSSDSDRSIEWVTEQEMVAEARRLKNGKVPCTCNVLAKMFEAGEKAGTYGSLCFGAECLVQRN